MIYRFGDFELDTDRFELRQGGRHCKVEPQVFALLELLISNHDRLVSKDEINLRVWGGRVVSDAVVNSRARAARQAIGDDGKAQRLIRTVHGRGFRFVGAVSAVNTAVNIQAGASQAAEPGAPGQSEEGASGGRPSIAVLPLHVLTPDERFGALGDAVSQEVILELSRLHWLFVIARGSSFRFRGPAVDLAAAGQVLGARYILSGTIAFSGRRSAVTVELARAADGQILWAERFDCPVDDLLQLRWTISGHIVTAIETRIQMAEADKARTVPTDNLDAWAAYHRGLWHMYRFNKHDNEIAARLFDRAVTADPDFARGYAGLSFTHLQNALVGYTKDGTAERALTRQYAEKCLALDPLDPFVNLTMARSEWIAGNLAGSLPWFGRSVEISPNYAFALYNRGLIDALLCEGQQSQSNVMKAIALSPIDPLNYAMLATRSLSHVVRGEFAEASEWGERAVRAPNAHAQIFVIAALAHELAGDTEKAQACMAHARNEGRVTRPEDFLRIFDFQSEETRAAALKALTRLSR